MEVEETGSTKSPEHPPRTKRRTKKKGTPRRKGAPLRAPSGSFCGPLIGQSATFFSSGDKVKLTVFVPPQGAAGQPVVPRLYLTYRFLRQEAEDASRTNQKLPSESKCDTLLTNCHFRDCVIRSPNFPGFYLRNITCHYWVRQDSAPPGKAAQIEIYQDNEFKINVPSGHTNNDRYKPGTLTSDCAGDMVKVYDGRTPQSPLLVEFCGAGPLPVIRSSGPDILVQLLSVPSQTLANSRFELAVRVHFIKTSSTFHAPSEGCSVTVDGGRHPVGILRGPDHSVPSGTTCTYRVTGKKPTDRIWFYFATYHIPDLHPWTDNEHCDVGKMDVIHTLPRLRHSHKHYHNQKQQVAALSGEQKTNQESLLVETYCEKRSPRQCGHASDFIDLIPSRPCTLPDESYLSPGPEVILNMTFLSSTAIRGTGSPYFSARYEVIETMSYKEDILTSPCVMTLNSRDTNEGILESPKNVFLYGRGGTRDLVCKYELRGTPDQSVRVTVKDVHFSSSVLCQTTYDSVVERQKCNVFHFGKFAVLNVTELWQEARVFVGCVCDSSTGFVLQSVGHMMDIEFLVRNMGPRDDFRTFHFTLFYEFVSTASVCEASSSLGTSVMSGSRGQLLLSLHNVVPFRCRWLLAAVPSRALYVTVKGKTYDSECKNKILFYNRNNWEPYKVFCPTDEDESFFTESWKPESNRILEADLTFLEYIVNEPGEFKVMWIEVTRPRSHPCALECPELEACVGEDLACDGIRHCPVTGNDETPERCNQFPLMTLAISSAAAVALVTVIVLGIIIRYRLIRTSDKTVIPPPDMYRNECKHTFTHKAPVR